MQYGMLHGFDFLLSTHLIELHKRWYDDPTDHDFLIATAADTLSVHLLSSAHFVWQEVVSQEW